MSTFWIACHTIIVNYYLFNQVRVGLGMRDDILAHLYKKKMNEDPRIKSKNMRYLFLMLCARVVQLKRQRWKKNCCSARENWRQKAHKEALITILYRREIFIFCRFSPLHVNNLFRQHFFVLSFPVCILLSTLYPQKFFIYTELPIRERKREVKPFNFRTKDAMLSFLSKKYYSIFNSLISSLMDVEGILWILIFGKSNISVCVCVQSYVSFYPLGDRRESNDMNSFE